MTAHRPAIRSPPCAAPSPETTPAIYTSSHYFSILWCANEAFEACTLRLQFRIFDVLRQNSGVFIRFRNPLPPAGTAIRARAQADHAPIDANPAWTAVYSGFEIQIDDTAMGDVRG